MDAFARAHRHPGLVVCALAILLSIPRPSPALEVEDLGGLVGFTIVAYTNVKADYAGIAPKVPVTLENGMVFEFSAPFSTYTYRPRAVVFADADAGKSGDGHRPVIHYKLLIENRLYEVTRIR